MRHLFAYLLSLQCITNCLSISEISKLALAFTEMPDYRNAFQCSRLRNKELNKSVTVTLFRNLRILFALILMDTNSQHNFKLIAILRKKVLGSNLLEVFLESAPQFILQSYIIMKTGCASNDYNSIHFNFCAMELNYKEILFIQYNQKRDPDCTCELIPKNFNDLIFSHVSTLVSSNQFFLVSLRIQQIVLFPTAWTTK